MKRKLSAVIAVAEPMEWQEYVKLGLVGVGCQTAFEEVASPIETAPAPLAVNTNQTLARSSVLPNKLLAPLTLNALLGKTGGASSPRKKENKYQKINSAAVPRSIGGLATSWRMNTDQLVQFAKKSLSVVLKIIADAYGEMLTAGRRKTNLPYAPTRGRELTLAQIVYQQFLHSYGLPGVADMHLLAFSCAIEMYRTQHLRVEYFARYCFEEVPKMELTNYLEFLECIVCDDVNVAGGTNGTTKGQQQQIRQTPSKRLRVIPRIVVPDRENWTIVRWYCVSVLKTQVYATASYDAIPERSLLLRDHFFLTSHQSSFQCTLYATGCCRADQERGGRARCGDRAPCCASVRATAGSLMTPQQRRAIQKAENNDRRLRQIIQARHSTCDVIGASHSGNQDPGRVRGEPYKSDLLSHDMSLKDQHEYRDFTSKSHEMNPRLNHHDRIFNETPVEWNPQRAQHLRNQFDGGRPYDVVNGGTINCCPPTIAEENHPRQVHPSVIVHPYTR